MQYNNECICKYTQVSVYDIIYSIIIVNVLQYNLITTDVVKESSSCTSHTY